MRAGSHLNKLDSAPHPFLQNPAMTNQATDEILCEVRGRVGLLTLNRARALNALTLGMVRTLHRQLAQWQQDAQVLAVAIRGMGRDGPFGTFCAGGDIRFLHAAGSSGNPQLEDFFTEEYALNHLTHHLGKPYIAFMDGVCMGGGMGISQGAALRLVTENSRLAMPETGIGLFPDVGGGWFLARCPGHIGEWLALTGQNIGAAQALEYGLADGFVPASAQAALWDGLAGGDFADGAAVSAFVRAHFGAAPVAGAAAPRAAIDRIFALPTVPAILAALHAEGSDWAQQTAATLRQRSPLMLHVVLEQIRRARGLTLAQDLRMERGLVRHCFALRPGQSETVEGIRALAVDKDHAPRWSPPRIEDVTESQWQAFFHSPWPEHAHPLAGLK